MDDLSEAGLIEDSIKIFWKTADIDSWTSVLMYVTDEPDTCTGWIPATADSVMIQYFIIAADSSGRFEQSPLAGYHEFFALPTNACQTWDLGDMDNSGTLGVIDILMLADMVLTGQSLGVCCDTIADINDDGSLNVMDVVMLVNQVLFP